MNGFELLQAVRFDTDAQAFLEAAESMTWYPKHGARIIGELADWIADGELGTYAYAADIKKTRDEGLLDLITFDYIKESGAGMVGDPDRCIEIAKRYEAIGCDLLFCLVNPYNIPHEQVMHSIELMGKYVLPKFD